MKTTMKMTGFKDMEAALMDLPKTTAKASVRRVLKKAGQPIADAGAGNAPQDEGHLAESYGVSTRLTKAQRRVSKKESEVEMYVGPNDPGAVQTEFGNDHQSAQPHLRPAWDTKKGEALDIIATEQMADIEKTVGRYNKRMAKGRK